MKIGATFSDKPRLAAAIGFFDGVHRGHRYLIEQVGEVARRRGLAPAVVTFSVHPRRVMQPGCPLQLLTTADEKALLLARAGVEYCLMLDFTPELAHLSARQFMALLKEKHGIDALVIGYDHRFGHNRTEGFDDYVRYGEELGIEVVRARAFLINSKEAINNKETGLSVDCNGIACVVSSSLIRECLQAGDVSNAYPLLGYEYFLRGTVVGGYRVGRTIGFPTANLRVDDADKLIPADGVYAVRVWVDDREYGGMLSIGLRPTIDNGTDRSIEVHIFDFQADIYNCPLRLSFVRRTRSVMKFTSVDDLIAQLHRDAAEVKRLLACM